MRFKFFYLIFGFIFLSLGCANRKISPDIQFEELAHGIAKVSATILEKSNESPSGNTVNHKGFKVIETTDTVNGGINLVFGIEFKINSKVSTEIEVERRWTFPSEMTDPDGNKFRFVQRKDFLFTNKWNWMGYTIEKEYEIMKGTWTLQYFYKGKEVYKTTFNMR